MAIRQRSRRRRVETLDAAAERLGLSRPQVRRYLENKTCHRDEEGRVEYTSQDLAIKSERRKKLALENEKLKRQLGNDDKRKQDIRHAFEQYATAIRSRIETLPFKLTNDAKLQNKWFAQIRSIFSAEVNNLEKTLGELQP